MSRIRSVVLLSGLFWIVAPRAHAAAPVLPKSTIKIENPRDGFSALKQLDPRLVVDDESLTQNVFISDTRAGFSLATGNTQSIVLTGLHKSTWRIKRFEHAWRLGSNYQAVYATTGTGGTGTTARHVYGTYRLDYYFTPRTTVFAGGGGYTDAVKGINVAAQAFGGVARYLVKRPAWYLRGSVGYDFTDESLDDGTHDQTHAATATLAYLHQISDTVKLGATVGLAQDLENTRDTRVSAETELRCAIAKHLDLSMGVNLRYDRDPVPGFKSLDTLTDVGVVLKF